MALTDFAFFSITLGLGIFETEGLCTWIEFKLQRILSSVAWAGGDVILAAGLTTYIWY